MSLSTSDKQYIYLCVRQIANATAFNSNAIRQLALAQLFASSGQADKAATQLELIRQSLQSSEEAMSSAVSNIAIAMGIAQ